MMNTVFMVLFFSMNAQAEPGQGASFASGDWMTKEYVSSAEELRYLGRSGEESSETSAVLMAEQDAITQMIKHYFGVKMKYSLSASESLSSVSLNIDKSESSDSIELRGIVRANIKVEKDRTGKFKAWVQISIPEKNLRAEKQRLESIRRAQLKAEQSRIQRKRAEEKKSMVPKLFIGMSRDLFVKSYPAPNSVIGSYPSEIFHYHGWNFCDGSYLGCYVHFFNGKLVRWDSVNSSFVDFARTAGP